MNMETVINIKGLTEKERVALFGVSKGSAKNKSWTPKFHDMVWVIQDEKAVRTTYSDASSEKVLLDIGLIAETEEKLMKNYKKIRGKKHAK